MKNHLQVAGALYLVLAVGCASSREGAASVTLAHAPLVKGWALGVPDTCVYVENTPAGADVIFTTTPPYVAQLRRRVGEQAESHGPGKHVGAGHAGVHGTAHGHGLRLWAMPVDSVRETETDRGARLDVIASEPSKVPELRAHLRERAATMRDRGCP
jgi:hypothetical protein